ncbi:myosin tail domain-containing protein [Sarocladium implicatum]|nr:myosin tail domain-containing protein [Sarocladium implicatum]
MPRLKEIEKVNKEVASESMTARHKALEAAKQYGYNASGQTSLKLLMSLRTEALKRKAEGRDHLQRIEAVRQSLLVRREIVGEKVPEIADASNLTKAAARQVCEALKENPDILREFLPVWATEYPDLFRAVGNEIRLRASTPQMARLATPQAQSPGRHDAINKELKAKLTAAEAVAEDLAGQVQGLEQTLRNHESTIARLETKKQDAEKHLKDVQAQNHELRSDKADRDKTIQELEDTVEQHEKTIEKNEAFLGRYEDTLAENEKDISHLNAQLADVQEDLTIRDESNTKLEESVSRLTDKVNELKTSLREATKNKEEANNELSQLQNEISLLRNAKSTARLLNQQLQSKREEYTAAASRLDSAVQEQRRLQQQLSSLEIDLGRANATAQKSKHDQITAERTVQQLHEEKQEMANAIAQLESKAQADEAQFRQQIHDMGLNYTNQREELEAAQSRVGELEVQLEAAQNRFQELEVQVQAAQSRVGEREVQLEAAQNRLQELDVQVGAAQNRAQELNAQVQAAQSEVKKLDVQVSASKIGMRRILDRVTGRHGIDWDPLLKSMENLTVTVRDRSVTAWKLQNAWMTLESSRNAYLAVIELYGALRDMPAADTVAIAQTTGRALAACGIFSPELATNLADAILGNQTWTPAIAASLWYVLTTVKLLVPYEDLSDQLLSRLEGRSHALVSALDKGSIQDFIAADDLSSIKSDPATTNAILVLESSPPMMLLVSEAAMTMRWVHIARWTNWDETSGFWHVVVGPGGERFKFRYKLASTMKLALPTAQLAEFLIEAALPSRSNEDNTQEVCIVYLAPTESERHHLYHYLRDAEVPVADHLQPTHILVTTHKKAVDGTLAKSIYNELQKGSRIIMLSEVDIQWSCWFGMWLAMTLDCVEEMNSDLVDNVRVLTVSRDKDEKSPFHDSLLDLCPRAGGKFAVFGGLQPQTPLPDITPLPMPDQITAINVINEICVKAKNTIVFCSDEEKVSLWRAILDNRAGRKVSLVILDASRQYEQMYNHLVQPTLPSVVFITRGDRIPLPLPNLGAVIDFGSCSRMKFDFRMSRAGMGPDLMSKNQGEQGPMSLAYLRGVAFYQAETERLPITPRQIEDGDFMLWLLYTLQASKMHSDKINSLLSAPFTETNAAIASTELCRQLLLMNCIEPLPVTDETRKTQLVVTDIGKSVIRQVASLDLRLEVAAFLALAPRDDDNLQYAFHCLAAILQVGEQSLIESWNWDKFMGQTDCNTLGDAVNSLTRSSCAMPSGLVDNGALWLVFALFQHRAVTGSTLEGVTISDDDFEKVMQLARAFGGPSTAVRKIAITAPMADRIHQALLQAFNHSILFLDKSDRWEVTDMMNHIDLAPLDDETLWVELEGEEFAFAIALEWVLPTIAARDLHTPTRLVLVAVRHLAWWQTLSDRSDKIVADLTSISPYVEADVQ